MQKLIYILSFLLLSTSGFSANKTEAWKKDMHSLRSNIVALSPYLYSESKYEDKKNKKFILGILQSLEKTGHKLGPDLKNKLNEKDPSIAYILENIENDFGHARESFQSGNFSFSQNLVKSAVNRCFQCHMQNYENKQWESPVDPKKLKFLSAREKVDLLIAIRNFKEALNTLEKYLVREEVVKNAPFEFENILKKYLVVSISVQQDPKKTINLLDDIRKKNKLPEHIARWVNNTTDALKQPVDNNPKDPLAYARKLLNAGDLKKEYEFDLNALVESLRAARILRKFNRESSPSKKQLAESYYLLGLAYQNISEPSLWDLHENYFERCIGANPHSQMAKKCFKKFEDSVELRHTGSSGTHYPLRTKMMLKHLREKSVVK